MIGSRRAAVPRQASKEAPTREAARSRRSDRDSGGSRGSSSTNTAEAAEARSASKARPTVVPDFHPSATTTGRSVARNYAEVGIVSSSETNSGNQVSPPRFTAETSAASSEADRIFGTGVFLQDREIVELLKQPPKTTLVLRTKGNFQDYFRGIKAARIRSLLMQAYSDVENPSDREAKVNKRMDLLREVVAE